jgi:hypothetical protein
MRPILFLLLSIFLAAIGAPAAAATAPAAPAAAPAEPDPIVLARMHDIARAGRFAEAYKRGLRASPASPLRDRVLALDDAIVEGVFARTLAPRFDIADATAIAAFYASADGIALTAAQLATPDAPAPKIDAEQRARIEAFFAKDPGRRFNAALAEKAVLNELQLALAFIAGPGK